MNHLEDLPFQLIKLTTFHASTRVVSFAWSHLPATLCRSYFVYFAYSSQIPVPSSVRLYRLSIRLPLSFSTSINRYIWSCEMVPVCSLAAMPVSLPPPSRTPSFVLLSNILENIGQRERERRVVCRVSAGCLLVNDM